MSPAPLGRGRKVRGVQTKRDVYNHVQTKYKRLGPFSNPKSEKGGYHVPSPLGRGRKVTGVQTKRDVYNHVQTKYKRLSPFSNPKSEKGGLATCTLCFVAIFYEKCSKFCQIIPLKFRQMPYTFVQ